MEKCLSLNWEEVMQEETMLVLLILYQISLTLEVSEFKAPD